MPANNAFCSTHYKLVTKAPYFDTTRCTDFGVNLKQEKNYDEQERNFKTKIKTKRKPKIKKKKGNAEFT